MKITSSEPVFEPSVLKWVRQEAGLSIEIVASKLSADVRGITPEVIAGWESGSTRPQPHHVAKLAECCKRPLAVFLLPSPPRSKTAPPDRRTFKGSTLPSLSPAGLLELRRVRRVQFLAQELLLEAGVRSGFRFRRFQLSDDPTKVGFEMRTLLGVDSDVARRCSSYGAYFDYLRERIEDAGVLTLRSGGTERFPLEDARAFSLTDAEPYVIVVNNNDTEGAKVFSLMHEFAHLLVREAGMCNNFSAFAVGGERVDTLEVFCNRFASSFLVPTPELLGSRALGVPNALSTDMLNATVRRLASEFKVSRYVILRKLLDAGRVDVGTYRARTAEWESEVVVRKKLGGRTVPAAIAFRNNGTSFSKLVYQAYKADRVSQVSAADYLGIKAKHIGTFGKIVEQHGR